MRRLDLHPRRKLRNPGRHLRQLAKWPGRIVQQIPDAAMLEGDRFWNFKVPVYSKVVEPPHATVETRSACLAAMLAAAEAIDRSPRRPGPCRVACLVTTPYLFESEVTIFVDEGYFRSFLPVAKPSRTEFEGGWIEATPEATGNDASATAEQSLASLFGTIEQRPEMAFFGGTKLVEFNADVPDRLFTRTNWVWAFPYR